MPLADNWDVYYVPMANPDPYPPTLDPYLQSAAVTSKIGSQSTWMESNMDVYNQFAATGDWMRSALPNLEAVINAGVRTVIYDGDADFIVNYMGVEAMVSTSRAFSLLSYSPCTDLVTVFPQVASLTTKFSAEFTKQNFATYTVDGKPAGLYKNSGHILVPASFRRRARSSRVPVAGRAPRRGGPANVHTDHVRPPALKYLRYDIEIVEALSRRSALYVRLEKECGPGE